MLHLLLACSLDTSLKATDTDPLAPLDTAPADGERLEDSAPSEDETGALPDTASAQPDDSALPDSGPPDTSPPDTATPPDTGAPPDTGTPPDSGDPDTEPPTSTVDPCPDAPDLDCPVDVLDPTPCTGGVAAWLPSGSTYTSVQAALDRARSGDTVAICPGSWSGTFAVRNPGLTLRGYGAASTTLDGGGAGTTLTVTAPSLTVAELTVTGGATSGSGGGIAAAWTELRLCEAAVTGNRASSGGGVYVGAGALEVEGGTFEGNTAAYQGGAVDSGRSLLTVVGARFQGNEAAYAGGAIFGAVEGGMAVYGSSLLENWTGYEGGAVAVNGSTSGSGVCFVETSFTGNVADYGGGAVSSNGWGSMSFGFESCTFDENYAAFGGGAIIYQQWGTDTSVTVNSTFTGNTAGDHGGAVDLSGGWGVLDASFYGTSFEGNTALLAGAIQAGGVGTERVLLVASAMTDNTARWAGGIYIDATSTIDVRNTDFGTGRSDNAPDDVSGYAGYGAAATFLCLAGVCS